MNCYERFKKKMNACGSNLREEQRFNDRALLEETFDDDTSFQDNVFLWKPITQDLSTKTKIKVRFYDRKYSVANGVLTSFISMYDTPVLVGDVLYDGDNDKYYICYESNDLNKIQWQGNLQLCNWMLKWQLHDGTILSYPCYDANSTQYNSGEKSTKKLTVLSSQHTLMLPCDKNTIALSTPQRLMISKNKKIPSCYVVTQNDTSSFNYGNGIVRVTVIADEFNPKTDNIKLGICDYKSEKTEISTVENTESDNTDNDNNTVIAEIISQRDYLYSGGSPLRLEGEFFNIVGNLKNTLEETGTWSFDFGSSGIKEKDLKIENVKNKISISIDNDSFVDEVFKIRFSNLDGSAVAEKTIKVRSIL